MNEENTTINKPLSMIISEATETIAEAINSCGLTPCLLEPIIKDLYQEIKTLKKQELEIDKKKYEEALNDIE